jgi:hypothetical protein
MKSSRAAKRGSPKESGRKEADGESSRKAMIFHINESFSRPQAGLTEGAE